MAIIKCPECGHSISDKAPVCPSCGVEIAGRIVICQQCGTAYFKNQPECPNCHHLTARTVMGEPQGMPATPPPPPVAQEEAGAVPPPPGHGGEERRQGNRRIVLVSLAIAVVAVVVGYVFYHNAQSRKENDAYTYAIGSNNPDVLQSYLDTYKDAPEEHIDSIQAHLSLLRQVDQDWTNALMAGTKDAIVQYMRSHPDSPFKATAEHKVDSIDWTAAQGANSVEALENYIEEHPSGEHIDDANDLIKSLNTKTVQPEEKMMVASAFNSFFAGLNARDEAVVTSSVSQLLTSFLGKANATRADVVTFMNKLYRGNVTSQKWVSLENYKISKKEIGDSQYEYSVEFSATQTVESSDAGETKNNYRINAKLNPDGQITQLLMTRILE